MGNIRFFIIFILLFFISSLLGCVAGSSSRRYGDYAMKEADWIKEGRPLINKNNKWYPTEYIENHLDSEMEYVGEFQQVSFYVERRQIKPYNRIYTKFEYHKYRRFTKKNHDRN